ncbi:MAG: hypothetical protein LBJ75_01590 [Puniceicoccales bacterium]|jgi:hypothetical protein|nr:hypothetical protein [Puniceicoccales bacterium]
MDIKTLPMQYSSQSQAVQQARDVVSERSGNIKLQTFLDDTGRSIRIMPDDGHSNSGFNAILEQAGWNLSPEMVSLLRRKLDYADGKPFERSSCLNVADLLHERSVVEIQHDGNQVVRVCFGIPTTRVNLSLKAENLFENFAMYCRQNLNIPFETIYDLVRVWENNPSDIPDFKPTGYDIMVKLLRCPGTIALVSKEGDNHFDAAPHGDLSQVGSVPLELLKKAKDFKNHRKNFANH